MRLLVAEDHPALGPTIVDGLREEGYSVDLSTTGPDALHQARTTSYDGLILDINLPSLDGFAVLKALRDAGRSTPVLCLTARDGLDDRVKGLDLGADDYLVKPFEWKELIARVRALIRRGHNKTSSEIRIGDLVVDTARKCATRQGQRIDLTAREYSLLEYLAHRANEVVSRTTLWEKLWDDAQEVSSNVVDVYIGYLRNKIDRPFATRLLHTRRGQGYILTGEDDEVSR